MSVDDNFDQEIAEEKKLCCTAFKLKSFKYVDQ